MQAHTFDKRIYTPATFLTAVGDLIRHREDLRLAVRRRHVDRAFAEKLMLVVTEVNRCRYCHVAHTWAARNAGVTEQEMLDLRVDAFAGLPVQEGRSPRVCPARRPADGALRPGRLGACRRAVGRGGDR